MSRTQLEVLKWIAFASMVIDHGAKADLFAVPGWQILGRLAFPLFVLTFSFSAAEKGRVNVRRLIVLGCIAQPAFLYVLEFQWYQLNVLFLFPAAWWVYQRMRLCRLQDVLMCGVLLVGAAVVLSASYGATGVVTVAAAIAAWQAKAKLRRIWFGLVAVGFGISIGNAEADLAVAGLMAGAWVSAYWVAVRWPTFLVADALRPRGRVGHGFGTWYVLHLCLLAGLGMWVRSV